MFYEKYFLNFDKENMYERMAEAYAEAQEVMAMFDEISRDLPNRKLKVRIKFLRETLL